VRTIGTTRARQWLAAYPLLVAFGIGVITASLLLPLRSAPSREQLGVSGAANATGGDTPGSGDATGAAGPSGDAMGPSGATAGVAGPPGNGSASLGSGSATDAPGGPNAPLTASDRGVTATTIKLGFTVLDTSKTQALGLSPPGYTTQGQIDYANAQLDAINAAGGINGRKVVGVFATMDPTNNSSGDAACQQLTEDEKVFAVIGGGSVRCVTQQHATPMFAPGTSASDFAAAGRLLATASPMTTREFRNWAYALDQVGSLNGKTVGILSDASQDADVNAALVPALRALGHSPFVYSLSSDIQTASSQIPIAVQAMRSHNVDALLVPTAFIYLDQFTQEAEAQLYRPRYLVSDDNGLTLNALVSLTGQSFDGAIGITNLRGADAASGEPEQAVATRCRETYNRFAHANLTYASGDPFFQICDGTIVFAKAATLAGPSLTRSRYAQATQQLGSFDLPGVYGGHFGPGKTDFADLVRPLVYRKSCHCWRNNGAVMSSKY
jgi:ABC-type branched-subunit amino acid transport system substrate-binding protein